MPIDIDDVRGLSEALGALTKNAGEIDHENRGYGYDGLGFKPVILGGELETELERLRFRLATLERKAELREETDTCLVCNRTVTRKNKSQPLLCEKHFIEWPKCPGCGHSGCTGLNWTAKHSKAKCEHCGSSFTGKEMQFRIAAYWASEYEE